MPCDQNEINALSNLLVGCKVEAEFWLDGPTGRVETVYALVRAVVSVEGTACAVVQHPEQAKFGFVSIGDGLEWRLADAA